jgi:hypothetical protein
MPAPIRQAGISNANWNNRSGLAQRPVPIVAVQNQFLARVPR